MKTHASSLLLAALLASSVLPAPVACAGQASHLAFQRQGASAARKRKVYAGGVIRAGMTGAAVRRRLGEPNRVRFVPVLNSRHFYQVWYYQAPGSASPHPVLELDEHDRVLSVRP